VCIVFSAAWDDKPISSLDLQRGLAFHQDFALAGKDVADLVAGMGVPARAPSGGDLDIGNHRFAPGHRDIAGFDDGPFDGGILRQERARLSHHACQPNCSSLLYLLHANAPQEQIAYLTTARIRGAVEFRQRFSVLLLDFRRAGNLF